MQVYSFKVALLDNKRIYRNIEIVENQTLADLHKSIFKAFERFDEHLYSFFLTRKATKNTGIIYDSPEFTHPMNLESQIGFDLKERYNAEKTKIGELTLSEKEKLYYLFDFGDEWWHELTVLRIRDVELSKGFPKIVKISGQSPPQYPDFEDDYDEDDDF